MVKTVKTVIILKLKIGQDPKVKDWIKNWINLKNRIGNWTKSRKLKIGLKCMYELDTGVTICIDTKSCELNGRFTRNNLK